MPFLLCFSYRLYYQYIFIYFSASSSDKENSSIIFLITSSVNNSPFSFPADVAERYLHLCLPDTLVPLDKNIL